jgi:hypothetical protein
MTSLLEWLGRYLNGPGMSRRGFFGRSARGAAAVVLALVGMSAGAQGAFAVRPVACCQLAFYYDCAGCGAGFGCQNCSGTCWDWQCPAGNYPTYDCVECYDPDNCSCAVPITTP